MLTATVKMPLAIALAKMRNLEGKSLSRTALHDIRRAIAKQRR
jgi:hypothetical protein